MEQVRRRLERPVADREARPGEPRRDLVQELGLHEQERAVVAVGMQQPAAVALLRVVEHDVVRGRDDRVALVLDHDARAGEDHMVPPLDAVLARPARVPGPAVELGQDDALALEHHSHSGIRAHYPVRRATTKVASVRAWPTQAT